MGDLYYSDVSLLLHCDGANGSTTFTDNSPSPKVVTPLGSTQISTTQSKFGGASAYIGGSGNSLSIPVGAGFQFGSVDFVVEGWVYLPSVAANQTIYYYGSSSGTNDSVILWVTGGGTLSGVIFSGATGYTAYAPASITANTWHHVALVRYGNTLITYLDGVPGASVDVTGVTIGVPTSSHIYIGSLYNTSTYPLTGYVDDFRITKGAARYTAAFTPQSTAFSNTGPATISGNVSATFTPASTMHKRITGAISGNVHATITPASSMHFGLLHTISGSVTTTFTPSAAFVRSHHYKTGAVTTTVTPAAALHKSLRYTINGSVSATFTVASAPYIHPHHYLVGGLSATLNVASTMRVNLHHTLAGSVTATITPAARMRKNLRHAVSGSVTATITPASGMIQPRGMLSVSEGSTLAIYGGGILNVSESATVSAYGAIQIPNTLTAVQDAPTLMALGGGALQVAQSSTVSIQAQSSIIAALSVVQPAPTVTLTADIGLTPTLTAAQNSTFAAFGAGTLAVTQLSATLVAASKTGSIGQLHLTQPSATFTAAGNSGAVMGVLNVSQPSLYANYGRLTAVQEAPTFGAWSIPVTTGLAAYSMNIKTAETTTYTNFNFKFIVRLGFDYYGVKADGLYKLGGTTDNGTAISASFTTAQDSYGTNSLKRNAKVYLDAETLTTVAPVIDGITGTPQISNYKGHKVSLGRGGTGKFWQFQVANVAGAEMRVGAMEVQLDILSRRI